MNNTVLGEIWKMWENIEILVVTTKLSYYKVFHRTSSSNRYEKKEILLNKPMYLGLSALEWSKILMDGFRYDYLKQKYGEEGKLC